jgi:hypothetical protein
MTLQPAYGLVDDRATLEAYLFACACEPLFAITRDPDGTNLPSPSCPAGWRLHSEFALGTGRAMPHGIDPEPVLRGLRGSGYYIWAELQGLDPRKVEP